PSHLHTLQRGVRKIRARLRATMQAQCQEKVIHADESTLASRGKPETDKTADPLGATVLPAASPPCQPHAREAPVPPRLSTEEEMTCPPSKASDPVALTICVDAGSQQAQTRPLRLNPLERKGQRAHWQQQRAQVCSRLTCQTKSRQREARPLAPLQAAPSLARDAHL